MLKKMKIPSTPVFFFFFFLSAGIFLLMEMAMAQMKTIPVNLGVVVDDDFESWVGKMWLSCINMSVTDFYASHGHYKTRLVLHTRASHGDVGAAVAAMDLIRNVEVEAIVGLVTSTQANLVTELGEKAQVPIISFSASSPSLTSIKSTYFFQATQNDGTQAKAISAIIRAFGWREAVPIYVDNEYGVGVIPSLMEALQAVDTRVPYQIAISPSASDNDILKELYKLMSMQTRVFIVHMFPPLGARLFTKAKDIGMMSEGYVWIMTDGITNSLSSIDSSFIDSMQGILGIKPYVPKTKELEYFRVRWKKKFHQDYPDMVDAELNVYGLWAYGATTALAMAIEKAGATNIGIQKGINASTNLKDLQTIKVSQNGPKLIQALSDISFKGLTGDFRFVNQQLQTSVFQIVNINGVGPRGIGFWTPTNGLIKKLNSISSASSYTSNRASLASIIWPGDPTSVPKGWEFPTNGKKLRIGVPSDGFSEFVVVTRDPITSTTKVTGYCIDVFDAAIKELPYAVGYDYFPFANPDGSGPAGTYDDLVYQVYLGKYDAVVGDVTIVANRSLYVDFTLPFIESEVSMLVRINEDKNNDAAIFLKPLSPSLWATTFCFFVFIAFVIWVLEHRINEDFRGSPSHQAGTSLWFAFSTMVFAHRERVINNLARIVVIIWSFVLLILTQSYTASLTSLLTVQQLHPAVTDVVELIEKRESVGYFNNSFVFGVLKSLGFQESNLKAYVNAEECDRLLSLGSKNGGIAAAFDESPYLNLILSRNRSNYTIIQSSTFMSKISGRNIQQFKTGGFGFVFPRGSPLVSDLSRAILKVTQNVGMKRIEDAWIRQESRCSDNTNSVSSSILGLDSFWGLFLIAGIVSFSALLIYITMFVYAQRKVLKPSDSETSALSKFVHLFRIFNQRDLKAYTIRSHGGRGVDVSGEHVTNAPTNSVHVNLPIEEATFSADYVPQNPNEQTSQEMVPVNIELAYPNKFDNQ